MTSGLDLSQKRRQSRRHPSRANHTRPRSSGPQKGSTCPDGRVLRKYVSRQLLALSEGEIAALRAAMRQLGVVSQRGVEALASFHQLIFDEWASGTPDTPQARINVDEKNCFGMTEWGAVRTSASSLLPKHAAVAGWKHRACP